MSIIKELTASLKELVKEAGYEVENLNLQPSGRKDLGQFQINDAMPLAKKYGKNPRMIAEDIAKLLEQDNRFTNINIAGPGFINITLTNEYLSELMNKISSDLNTNIDKEQPKKIASIFINWLTILTAIEENTVTFTTIANNKIDISVKLIENNTPLIIGDTNSFINPSFKKNTPHSLFYKICGVLNFNNYIRL